MIVVDTSALAAVLLGEPDSDRYLEAMLLAGGRIISSPNLLEMHVVAARRGIEDHARKLDLLIAELDLRVEPFGSDELALARVAFDRYGKGRHPAALNFGDCFAYSLAKATGYPLLFKGDDFARTDAKAALDREAG